MKKLLTLLALSVANVQAKNFSFTYSVFGGVSNSGFKYDIDEKNILNDLKKHKKVKENKPEKITIGTLIAEKITIETLTDEQKNKNMAKTLEGITDNKTGMIFGGTIGTSYKLSDSTSAGLEAGLLYSMAQYEQNALKTKTKKSLIWTFGSNFTYNINSKFSVSLAANMLLNKLEAEDGSEYTRHLGFGPKLSADYMFTKYFGATVFAGYFFFPGSKILKNDGKEPVINSMKIKHKNMFIAGAGFVAKL